ncbi:hypothetical protein ABZ215_19000 [Amycolatopsis sp. NPDC006131]|uniref:hypothetical protein n=1 Tax=Amycolatopsis sp. NPDC006131 TaxID=3156731 RepID=UPI0033B30909
MTVSKAIRFVEVTQEVLQRIVAERYAEVEFARTTHEVFTSLNIACASSTDIVTQASQLACPRPLPGGHAHRALVAQWAERSGRQEADPAAEGWASVEVGLGPERWARLVLPERVRDRARVTMVLERVAQSLRLQRMIQQERDVLVGQAHGGLLDDLRAGRITDDSEALARAEALGLTRGALYVPIVVRARWEVPRDVLRRGERDRGLLTAVRGAITTAGPHRDRLPAAGRHGDRGVFLRHRGIRAGRGV